MTKKSYVEITVRLLPDSLSSKQAVRRVIYQALSWWHSANTIHSHISFEAQWLDLQWEYKHGDTVVV